MSAIQDQIEEDGGECGARVRKNAQRNADANPTKGVSSVAVPVKAPKKKRGRVARTFGVEN